MALHNEIFTRFKRTLGIFTIPTLQTDRPADFLVKMNLPPLMGRRDAAGDRIGGMIKEDLFTWSEQKRIVHYRDIGALLDSMIVDTQFILSTLSSPDTESREKRLLAYFTTLREISGLLEDLCRIELKIFRNLAESTCGLIPENNVGDDGEQTMNESEIALVNQFRELYDAAAPKLARYRGYAAKSFSKQNADRYHKAYEEYSSLFSAVGD